MQNDLAWFLATCPDATFRDAGQALTLAKQAVETAATEGPFWNTLGIAEYRAGDWNAAREALEKSRELRSGGDSSDFFFLAMAHWRLGDKEQARKWYNQAVEWMEKNRPQDEELRRFRDEAKALLDGQDPAVPQGQEPGPRQKSDTK